MNVPESAAPIALDARQQIQRRRMSDHLERTLRVRADSPLSRYGRMVGNRSDWKVIEQPLRELPYALNQLITVDLRDQGNALIEETRQLNNRFAGHVYRDVEAILSTSPDSQDLLARVIAWGEVVADQVVFKLRNRAKIAPLKTFDSAYSSIVGDLDTRIVHGFDRMYMLIWSTIVDMLPYKMIEGLLLKPGLIGIHHDPSNRHIPSVDFSEQLLRHESKRITDTFSLYCVEPTAYVDTVVLRPLLDVLACDTSLPKPDERHARLQAMLADLLEAAPYLVASLRPERFTFAVPGSGKLAAFSFVPGTNCATFLFTDDAEGLQRALHTTFCRGSLMLGYNGQIANYMHPWRTLTKVYGQADGELLAYWLLQQVHGRIVQDYLKIQHYFLHEPLARPDDTEMADMEEALVYVVWAKASEGGAASAEPDSSQRSTQEHDRPGDIAQLRRRHFFKLLARCGVSIEQGKGSEIKLLRAGWHPFRLGNHYGSNPCIPSFLAVNILKRLGITRDEWLDAVAAD